MNPILKFTRLTLSAVIPRYAHEGDSGMDICADEEVRIIEDAYVTISTGIAAEIPEGYELQVRPRSGLASKQGIHACFGTVDCGYRGEIKVTLFSHYVNYRQSIQIHRGDRIAQLVLAPVVRAEIVEVDGVSADTERGADGFGSTGISAIG